MFFFFTFVLGIVNAPVYYAILIAINNSDRKG